MPDTLAVLESDFRFLFCLWNQSLYKFHQNCRNTIFWKYLLKEQVWKIKLPSGDSRHLSVYFVIEDLLCAFIHGKEAKFKFEIFLDGNGKVHRTSALASLKAFKIVFVPFAASIVKQFTGSILWVEVVPENNKGKTYIFYLGNSKSPFWARINQTLLGLEVCVSSKSVHTFVWNMLHQNSNNSISITLAPKFLFSARKSKVCWALNFV